MARLRRVSRNDLKISRLRRGRGFTYLDADETPVTDKDLRQRIASLVIPPAWTGVRIAPAPNAHIQAMGTDAAGRVQYIYHPDWEARRTRTKLARLSLLAEALPRIRRRVSADLSAETGSRELALAVGIALIDRTAMRVGRERYLTANGTRGAGTLYARDVTISVYEVCFRFPAKSGKQANYCIHDPALADAVSRLKTIPGRRLLVWRNAEGAVRPLRTEELNAYLKQIAGVPVTAKDFRTLHASAMAGEALAALDPGTSPTARKRQLAGVVKQVAGFLQNTPAICRTSYIAPCLFSLFESGRLGALWSEETQRKSGLRLREARLGAVLAAAA